MHECLKRAGKKSGLTTDQIAAISIMVETMSRLCAFKLNYKHTPVLIREIAKCFGFSLQRLYKLMYSRLSLTVGWKKIFCQILGIQEARCFVGASRRLFGDARELVASYILLRR